ncbi:hypothetical protein [Paucisalibacillus globulus]|uniref:hypothetical protein n=1 Tax=Paucisalibacillus globulus TaxID=351095 RepID=UPI0003F77E74|nr:hypothetical protein [Paucisalibacillus globulus]
MGNIVYANVGKVVGNVEVVDSFERVRDRTVLFDLEKIDFVGGQGDHRIYIPATMIGSVQGENVFVYHELGLYPFFQKAKKIILESGVPKGVFRLRRIIESKKNRSVIASDLVVLSTVFGEPERIVIKHSPMEMQPAHVIVMISFNGGTMAHVDYTFTGKEYIELEWSGIGQIIEFNSAEMNPMNLVVNLPLTLQYHVESILETSMNQNSVWKDFQRFQQLVGGADE